MSDASDHRWNFEEGVHGRVLRCTNDHPKGYPCEYEPLTAEEAEGMADLISKQGAEITTLRQQLEQSEMRCTELGSENESLWETFVKVSDYLGIDNEAARKIPGKPSIVFRSAILRKQAEAVEAFSKPYTRTPFTREIAKDGHDYAQSLRQQADEIESSNQGDI